MFELYLDQINVVESKQKEKLIFKKHDWTDEFNIPILILIFPVVWIFTSLYNGYGLFSNGNLIPFFATLFLVLGAIFLYINLFKIWNLKSIKTQRPLKEKRELILKLAEDLGMEIIKNNDNFFIGTYDKSFPFTQIVTIIYSRNNLLFNARNNCIGYNGKLGRPPFGLNAGQKLFEIFKTKMKN